MRSEEQEGRAQLKLLANKIKAKRITFKSLNFGVAWYAAKASQCVYSILYLLELRFSLTYSFKFELIF